jgi:hypothetical protein
MAFWLWLGLVITLVVSMIAAVLSSIRIRFRYSHSGQLDQLVIIIQGLYGLLRYRATLPSIVIHGWNIVYREKSTGEMMGKHDEKQQKHKIGKEKVRRYIKSYRSLLHSTRDLLHWVRVTLKKVECTRWRLDFRVGTGDAPATAMLIGLLWTVSGCASGAVGQFLSLKTSPQSRIVPNYSNVEFTVVWEADFRMRLSAAIVSWIKLRRLKRSA